jgi:hypothetical protein
MTMTTTDLDKDYERKIVGCAFGVINQKGWRVEHDAKSQCWDIETPTGWHTCWSGRDLWAVIHAHGI